MKQDGVGWLESVALIHTRNQKSWTGLKNQAEEKRKVKSLYTFQVIIIIHINIIITNNYPMIWLA